MLFIVSSPSGAGKTTLTHRLLQDFPDLGFSVSHTTRAPRANEVNGQDYHFVSEAEFAALMKDGKFAESAKVHGHSYGTSTSELSRAEAAGKLGLLFDVDYQGARQIKAKYPNAVAIFILPPSMDELRRRLVGRGLDDEETMQRRFAKAKEEIEHYSIFDYVVVNDDLQQALAELRSIIRAERCRSWRHADRAESLLRD